MTRPYYYLGKNWGLTQLSTGSPFFVNTDDHGISTWIILGGVWETFVDRILCAYVQPGMTVLDVGANLGYYTVKLGHLIGETGRLFSFEPNPELTPFIRENIAINGLQGRCVFHECGASNKEGSAVLSFDYSNMGGGGFWPASPEHRSVTVALKRIDDVLASVERCDLIKIDVEGHEPLALRGAADLLSRSPECAILFEASLQSWSYFGPVDVQIMSLVSDKALFAVPPDGTLPFKISRDEIIPYLERRSAGVSYFFTCPSPTASRFATYAETQTNEPIHIQEKKRRSPILKLFQTRA